MRKDSIGGATALIWASNQRSHRDRQRTTCSWCRRECNVHDIYGATAMMWASIDGHTEIVNALLAAGADVSATNNFGRTPLMLASIDGHTETVNTLLAAGAIVKV